MVGWILFATVYCMGAVGLGIGPPSRPLPGFMPLLIGLFLGGIALFSLLGSLWGKEAPLAESGGTLLSFHQIKKPLLIFGALIGYGLILDRLGFLASTSLLMLFLFKGIEPQRWGVAVLWTILTAGFSYLIFVVWLGCQFPTFWK